MQLSRPVVLLCLIVPFSTLYAETTEAILTRMNQAAPLFTGVSADLKMTTFNKILDDSSDEIGTLKMQRLKPQETRAVIDFSSDTGAPRILSFEGKKIQIYYPKLNEYYDYGLKNANVLNQYLLLGFGSSGKDLQSSYTISNEGVEKVGSVATTKLVLIPKSPEVKEQVAKVEIWIREGEASPIQQKFLRQQPVGNFQQVLYSHVVINPPGQKVELKLPRGAQKQKKE